MSMTDPIADLLTRIRNANLNNVDQVEIPFSSLKRAVAEVLAREGYVRTVAAKGDGTQKALVVTLRYGPDGERVINSIDRVSKPGCRVYTPVTKIPRIRGGMGICILSTPKGVLSDRECRKQNVGGEIIARIG
ncbi:MAG: 30S ribosomal protein S8 [Planctomycetes bacterium]|nr:30S ribosomal protein S8 [Planctomycetota bacterium]